MILNELFESLRTENPCWKGYHPVGTKKKNGRTVPNCVPNANESAAPGGRTVHISRANWNEFTAWMDSEGMPYDAEDGVDVQDHGDTIVLTYPENQTLGYSYASDWDEQDVEEGVGKDLAKLGGMSALAIGAGLAGNYMDKQEPRVEIGGKQAYYIENPGWGRVPDNAMSLKGKDGKEYKVWGARGNSGTIWYATPAEKVKEGMAEGSDEQVYKVVALDKSNALKKPTKLNVKASSIEDVFSRLAVNDWYALSINGVEVEAGKRLKQGVAEGDKIGGMDADKFDDAMARLKKLAGQGPLKTVWDPQKRVYRNVPVAQQPSKK